MSRLDELKKQRASTAAEIEAEERREFRDYQDRVRKAGEAQKNPAYWLAIYPDGRFPH